MAKPNLVAASGDATPKRSKTRRQMDMTASAPQASYEVEQLSALLSLPGMDQRADTFVYVARGLGRRIHALNGIIMSAIGESEIAEQDVEQYERELYG